jgi:adenylate kinase family enzyme
MLRFPEVNAQKRSLQRIAIVGTTGCGKSTLAKRIASSLDLVHYELDSLHWEPNWIEVSDDVFKMSMMRVIEQARWIVDGNYGKVRDQIWARADCIVWLDYSLPVILTRLVRRTLRRVFTRESCCNGNHERLLRAFSSDSVVLWALRTYARRRREYPKLLAAQEAQDTVIVVHRTPAETEEWIRQLAIPVG